MNLLKRKKTSLIPSVLGPKSSTLNPSSDKDGKPGHYVTVTSEFNEEVSLHANLRLERDEFEKQSVMSENEQERALEEFMERRKHRKQGLWSGQDIVQGMSKEKALQITSQLNSIRVYPHGLHRSMWKRFRMVLKNVSKSGFFENFMTLCVTINTITLSLDRYDIPESQGKLLQDMNTFFTVIFCIEMLFKIVGLGPRKYIHDRINYLDGAIVILSLIELGFFREGSTLSAFRTVRIFRTFRVLRVARLLRTLHSMQVIIGVISRSISSFIYIAILLMLFVFIYSLLGSQLFGGQIKNGEFRSHFDSFNQSFVTTFQLLTMENWQMVLYELMPIAPVLAPLYLVSWIFIGNFILLNLFLAILLDSFAEEEEEEALQLEEYEEHEKAI